MPDYFGRSVFSRALLFRFSDYDGFQDEGEDLVKVSKSVEEE